MRKSIVWFCILLGLFWAADAYSAIDPAIINDAAFSPDGKTIGIGTHSGFQLLDQQTKVVIYSYPSNEGVKYIKWAPDSQRILLASWREQENPIYSLLDIRQNRILFSFQDKVRWFSHFTAKEYDWQQEIFEEIYPRSTELGHAGAMAFSPHGNELAYITNAGPIRIRSSDTGELIREFPLSDYHATSLGYTPDGERIWIGIIIGTPAAYTDSTRLLYVNSHSGEIQERRQLIYDSTLVKGPNLFWVYAMRLDQKYALAVSEISFFPTVYFNVYLVHYLVDMELGKPTKTIVGSNIDQIPFHRASFGTLSDIVVGLSDVQEFWGSLKYDYNNSTLGRPNDRYPYRSVPIQPFSPDGSHFLMIDDRILDIVESVTWKHQVVHMHQTDVEDYQQHEPLHLLKEK